MPRGGRKTQMSARISTEGFIYSKRKVCGKSHPNRRLGSNDIFGDSIRFKEKKPLLAQRAFN